MSKVVPININLKDYDDHSRLIYNYRYDLSSIRNMDFPDSSKNTLSAFTDAFSNKINEYESQLDSKLGPFKKLISGIEKNCKIIVAAYKRNQATLFSNFRAGNADFLYGQTTEKIARTAPSNIKDKVIDRYDSLMKTMNYNARPNNSITLSTSGSYMIFPKDGFNITWLSHNIDSIYDNPPLDKNKIKEAFYALKAEFGDKFNNHFYGAPYGPEEFFSAWNWGGNYNIIQNNRKISPEIIELVEPSNLITEKSILELKLKTSDIDSAIRNHANLFLTGKFYAISSKYESLVRKILEY